MKPFWTLGALITLLSANGWALEYSCKAEISFEDLSPSLTLDKGTMVISTATKPSSMALSLDQGTYQGEIECGISDLGTGAQLDCQAKEAGKKALGSLILTGTKEQLPKVVQFSVPRSDSPKTGVRANSYMECVRVN
ncbi:hypothetical protein K2X33_10835 [bacterium]|nr:hypothetical protein [bacterium]